MTNIELSEIYRQWRTVEKEALEFHQAFVQRLGISRKITVEEHLRHDCELQARSRQLFEEYKKAVQETYNYTGRAFKYKGEYVFVSDVKVQDRNGAICFYGIGFKLMGKIGEYNWGFLSRDPWILELDPSEDPAETMQEITREEFMVRLDEAFVEWKSKITSQMDIITKSNGNRQGETAGDVSRA